MKDFLYVARRRRAAFAGAMLASLVLNCGMTLLNPLFLKYVFDEGVMKADFRRFALMLVGFIALATVARFLSLRCSLRVQELKNGAARDLSVRMLAAYYRQPYRSVLAEGSGYFASRIFDEPLAAAGASVELLLEVSSAALSFLISFAIVASLSLPATGALALTVPFLLLLAAKYRDAIKRHSGDEKENEGRLRALVAKAAKAYRTVNLFGLEGGVRSGLGAGFDAYAASVYARARATGVQGTLAAVLLSYGEVLVTLACGYEMIRGRMTFGGYMAFMSAFWMAVGHMRALVAKVPEAARNRAAIERLRAFEGARAPRVEPSTGAAALENASFRYGDADVFSGVSLGVADGESILLSGRNGTGKSTIANILAGFLLPHAGVARTPGVARTSACVTPHHFAPGTLRDNLGLDALSDDGRRYALELVRELDLANQLDAAPDGLSAGQRKKAEVIMGLSKEADLYLFDEPLANVDADSKPAIMRRIFERTRGKKLVVVMHGDDELKSRFDRTVELGPISPVAG